MDEHGTLKNLRRLWRKDGGQGLIEYMLIILLVAIAVMSALTLFGGEVQNLLNNVVTSF
ncbi:MAG: Flp family type IVb pilin [Nitrospinota bacterium]